MANNKDEKRTICKVIDYKKDIEPYTLIKIYSGVGSGKSYFASAMMTGSAEYKIPEQNVLLITSRRSKVEETLKELGVAVKPTITKNGNLSFDVWQTGEERPPEYEKYMKEIKFSDDLGEQTFLSYNKSVVCTNAFISAYLRNVYNPDDPITHIWNKFDSIIIDEVHSLVTDSTYQSATFDVLALIKEYLNLVKNNQLQECACKHLILMTGTPQPFESFVKFDFPQELINRKDLFDECENVVPKKIILIDEQTSKNKIRELLSNGKKVIYFTNHTMTEYAAREKFELNNTKNIGVSFSNDDKRKNLSKEEREKIKNIDESLAKNNLIPDNIQFFVTTSRNKEGININNTDYQYMFVETHLMYDVVQMAGRVRCGVENLYIISDTQQFADGNDITDILFSKKIMVENEDIANSEDKANTYLNEEYLTNDVELEKSDEDRRRAIMHYVKYIENRFAYIRYNIFNQKFEYFTAKENAEKIAALQRKKFKEILLDNAETEKYIKYWFPQSLFEQELSAKAFCAMYLAKVVGKDKYVKLSKDELKTHLSVVRSSFNSDLTQIKPILKLVDDNYNYIKRTKDYILYYGDKDPRIKRKPMGKRRKA